MSTTQFDWYLSGQFAGAAACAVIRVDCEPFVIGRRPGLSLTLSSPFVSGRHAELNALGERLFVTDLDSRNGTLVNGKRIRRSQLGVGDLLTIGDTELRLDRRQNDASRREAEGPDLNDQQAEWLSTQLPQLFRDHALTTVVRAVYRPPEPTPAAYRASVQSSIAGLETEVRMCAAGRQLGCLKDVHRLLLLSALSALRQLAHQNWLYVAAPHAVNLESELVPTLELFRKHCSRGRIVVELDDAPARSLRTLQDLALKLRALDIPLALRNFASDDVRFLQSSCVEPVSVCLDPTLTRNLAQRSGLALRRLRSLVDQLHHHGIQAAATDIDSAEDASACDTVGIDWLDGPLFGEALPLPSLPLPDTDILVKGEPAPPDQAAAVPPAFDPGDTQECRLDPLPDRPRPPESDTAT